ncbi:MAG: UbiA family prenyltransferase, partial [Pseudomonadota bacterium]
GGRAHLKAKIAERAGMDRARLPINEALHDYLKQQKALGRPIFLASAADARIVSAVAAQHADIFEAWFASDGETNLSGRRKLARIEAHSGGAFVYAGDAPIDAKVWASAAGAILVGSRAESLKKHVPPGTPVEASFPTPPRTLGTWARAIRLRQWAKNALVFVPIVLAGQAGDTAALRACFAAFMALGLAASATYLLNDLLDLDSDRAHPVKRRRPLAAGEIPAFTATVAIGVLITLATIAAAFAPVQAALGIAIYVVLTVGYSFRLKSVPLLDVLTIAGLFTLRIAIGVAAAQVAGSLWLFTFAMFFFFSLALTKRFAELRNLADAGAASAAGRGYAVTDLGFVQTLGVAAGMVSVNVFVLYLATAQFDPVAFPSPDWLWGACVVMGYWVSRMWLLAARGVLDEDPIEFALKDPTSIGLGALVAALAFLAQVG